MAARVWLSIRTAPGDRALLATRWCRGNGSARPSESQVDVRVRPFVAPAVEQHDAVEAGAVDRADLSAEAEQDRVGESGWHGDFCRMISGRVSEAAFPGALTPGHSMAPRR